jgi:hypothetical protein
MFGPKKILDIPSIEDLQKIWEQVMNPQAPAEETFGVLQGQAAGNGQPQIHSLTPGGEA